MTTGDRSPATTTGERPGRRREGPTRPVSSLLDDFAAFLLDSRLFFFSLSLYSSSRSSSSLTSLHTAFVRQHHSVVFGAFLLFIPLKVGPVHTVLTVQLLLYSCTGRTASVVEETDAYGNTHRPSGPVTRSKGHRMQQADTRGQYIHLTRPSASQSRYYQRPRGNPDIKKVTILSPFHGFVFRASPSHSISLIPSESSTTPLPPQTHQRPSRLRL
ncbi:hypothetical protein GGS23DRAFT_590416 [Durotheca rogersii]|uniref:uncharacterized protein n=1 Tax=Durotheca rogersii TaxID=419775 RepID=UPI0022209583|nr:uncharacterized protein GGS23DRAFT_590416 [Durotheca rogersii]KAI5855019.1 hypothetical protein GGS23DRAFT_590416 [Durotheca rogersii]